VWDENDCNVDPGDGGKHERWEGVINSRYGDFPQIGGPSCGTVNKRYEVDVDNSGEMRLYASPVDGRLHLLGAERGTLWADDSGDGEADRAVEYQDTDGDGFFDRWRFDDDADGEPERALDVPDEGGLSRASGSDSVPLHWPDVTTLYRPLLEQTVAGHERVAGALDLTLTERGNRDNLEIRRWALERQIHLAFRTRITAAITAGDERQARRLRRAQDFWEGGDYERTATVLAPSVD
jgi:hypothetical protein